MPTPRCATDAEPQRFPNGNPFPDLIHVKCPGCNHIAEIQMPFGRLNGGCTCCGAELMFTVEVAR